MNAYLNYIIEANAGLLLFLACYYLLLRGETSFRLLRSFMLTGIIASLLFPLVHLEDTQAPSSLRLVPAYWLREMTISDTVQGETQTGFSFWSSATLVYVAGLTFFFLAMLFQLRRLIYMVSNAKTYKIKKLHIAESAAVSPTFSFFNFIFIGNANALSAVEKQQIIQHEAVHAQQWHSFDILLLSLLKIVFWFNPFITIYQKLFTQLHEFEADARTVETTDANGYCSLLAKVALKSAGFSLANHFNQSLTLKRITMIRTAKHKISRWKVASCALLIPATFLLLGCQDQVQKGSMLPNEIKIKPEVSATPVSGMDQFYKTIKRNLRYPAVSRSNHKHGNVLLQFAVNEDGTLTDFQILESPDDALSQEAIRVVQLGGNWTPARNGESAVRQEMVLPIHFKLDYPGMDKNQQIESPLPPAGTSALEGLVVVGYANS